MLGRYCGVAVIVGVFLLASSAQGAIANAFGVSINNSNNLNAMNGGLGEGAAGALSNSWKNSNVQQAGGVNWTDGAQSVTIYNQLQLQGASSYYNGTRGAGTALLQGAGKTHYYGQNEKIVGLDTLGWTGVDIYAYGMNGGGYVVNTNPGGGQPSSGGANGTVVTNGGWQAITAWNINATSYTQGVNYIKWSNIAPASTLWVNMQQTDWSALEIVRAELPIVTVTGDPVTPADWATGTTWDLNPTTPNSTHTAYVRHTVSLSGAGAVAALSLDNAASDLRIESGASLAATNVAVSNGSLLATGAVNASKLTVTGGTATVAAGSASAITTAAVSGGIANLSGGTIGTVNASGGTTNLATNVTTALNPSGTATVNVQAAGVSAAIVALPAKGSGAVLNAPAGNELAVTNKATQGDITITAGSAPFKLGGANVVNNIGTITLQGGVISITLPPPSQLVTFSIPASQVWTSTNQNTTRTGVKTIDGSGLTGTAGSQVHDGNVDNMWDSGNAITGQWIAWDLGSVMTLDKAHVWNGNRDGTSNRGIQTADILVSNDNSTWTTVVSGAGFPQAPGTGGYAGFDSAAFSGITGRYVRLNVINNWGNAQRIDLAEIQFYKQVAQAIDLGTTSLALTADSTLDIGGASTASFFDVFLEAGVAFPKTLRIKGTNYGTVSSLASFFDVTAPNAANVSLGATDGTTYQDVVVIPEPATMSLLVRQGGSIRPARGLPRPEFSVPRRG
ncbi:MAG: discoidin domain-containing protein [Planctomycetota bacterium]|nr:discoidin domain-containing protein [Planctomycetota bacterium]